MLLAAGRGERMRPLTDTCPKPLLEVQGLPLLQWHLQALAQAGVDRAVINTAWLGEQISERFSSHFGLQGAPDKRHQLSISYSHEGVDFGGALETAGGIARALPQLGPVFWLAAGDVFAPDFVFDAQAVQAFEASGHLAHLWLVPNPAHNPRGDFGLSATGLALNLPADDPAPRYTYSTIALLRAELLAAPGAISRRATPQAWPPRWPPCCAAPWTRGAWGLPSTPGAGRTWARPSAWPNSTAERARRWRPALPTA